MSNIIEESMIINRLTSPLKPPNVTLSPNQLSPKQIEVQLPKTPSRQSSKNNLLDQTQQRLEHPKSDSDNLINPMSSLLDVNEDVKDRELDIDVKQVLTEINDQQTVSYQNLDDQQELSEQKLLPNEQGNYSNQISKHKQIMTRKPNTIRHQSYDQQTLKQQVNTIIEKNSTNTKQKQIQDHLLEIYNFYSKQAVSTNKYTTFDKLSQISNTMILQKYMFFCKDFQLIDLEITNEFVEQLGGKFEDFPKRKRKNQFKFNHKSNVVITKFQLVEIYKKNANKQMELDFENFEAILIKIAQTFFPEKNAIELLHEYLGVKDPKLYRKKMTVIGKPFNSKDQGEILTQEKLQQRKIHLPPRPKVVPNKKEIEIEETPSIQLPKLPKKIYRGTNQNDETPEPQKTPMKWEDLNEQVEDLDLKLLIMEQDMSDKEDDYYLQEYSLSMKRRAQKPILDYKVNSNYNVPAIQTFTNILNSQNSKSQKTKDLNIDNSKILITQNTRNSINKSFDVYDNQIKKKSSVQSPLNIEQNILEKQNQLYRAFLNQQSYREKMVNKKKMVVI